MLLLENIRDKALELAQAGLGLEVKNVVVETDTDAEGEQSLRVTIVIKSPWTGEPSGRKLNTISSQLNSYLSKSGDSRFAYTHYMTAREFTASNAQRKSAPKRRSAVG
ncbi:MAG TPA: hypothetical protein VHU87_12735 [Rhizomicrobium sp.]|jgi:hypothetical protein|nr:hypothetical protein [Rhizomicrobium sp.]